MLRIVALRAFYDGSGTSHDPGCRFVNLGSFVGTEAAWPDLKSGWLDALNRHDAPRSNRGSRYFHSKEAMHNKQGYKDWNSQRVSKLVRDLFNVLAQKSLVDPLALSCSVKLDDYRKVKASIVPTLRPPEIICLDACFGIAARHPGRDSGLELVFDREESFYPILKKAWKHEVGGKRIWWASYVALITETDDMRDEPEIQAADLLGWLANRYHTHGSGDIWGSLFFNTFLFKKHYHTFIDEGALLALFNSDGSMKPDVELPGPRIQAPFLTTPVSSSSG